MTRRRTTTRVYTLIDMPNGEEAVIRYSGDPDEFTALAHAWLAGRRHRDWDEPVAVLPPEPKLYRMNVVSPAWMDDYSWVLAEVDQPGRGVWRGALLRTVQIGCTVCHQMCGRHGADCLNDGLTGLVTLQFTCDRRAHGPFASEEIIHAVRVKGTDTPGNTLCDMARFDDALNLTWKIGGVQLRTDLTYRGCYRCGQVARREFPGLTITGTRRYAEVFAADCEVPLAPHLIREPVGATR